MTLFRSFLFVAFCWVFAQNLFAQHPYPYPQQQYPPQPYYVAQANGPLPAAPNGNTQPQMQFVPQHNVQNNVRNNPQQPHIQFVQNQPAPRPVVNEPTQKAEDADLVQLNFPNEVDLEVLVEYIAQRLELKILFDEAIANKKIRLRTTGDIPVDSLMQVLQSALKMKELTIVDADVAGWKRIVPVAQLGTLAPQGNAQQILRDRGGATPVMQIFMLEHADVTQVRQTGGNWNLLQRLGEFLQRFAVEGVLCQGVENYRVANGQYSVGNTLGNRAKTFRQGPDHASCFASCLTFGDKLL